MDFFEHQDRARRLSARLVLLLLLAVAALIALASLALTLILRFSDSAALAGLGGAPLVDWALVAKVAALVIGVVLLGGLYKGWVLRRGGRVVAERLGGRLINLEPRDLSERRLLNVVEEMAIASGIAVPPVYVLDEPAINAFAAGLTPQDAVIGVTRGALERLSRDELQGVVAHEFSHIFHGDMRLNTRLVSVLHGILLLGLTGRLLLRGLQGRSRGGRSSGLGVIVLMGAVLWVIGYAGTFFGNLIKAAVSRQREFLADAAAVQYTRNAAGIGGALKKIGGHLPGSHLAAANAAEFSHMYFGQGVSLALEGWMATHPALAERIRRLEPGWDGRFIASRAEGEPAASTLATPLPPGVAALGPGSLEQALAAVGNPGQAQLRAARQVLGGLPTALHGAAHERTGAQALVYALLLAPELDERRRQLEMLGAGLPDEVRAALRAHEGQVAGLEASQRLPLLELAIPALKQLDRRQMLELRRQMATLIRADGRVSLMEWCLLRIVERNLAGPRPLHGTEELAALCGEARVLMAVLAHAGHADEGAAARAFETAMALLPGTAGSLPRRAEVGLRPLEQALRRLGRLKPLQKPRLLKAMAACIAEDGQLTVAEAELFRAVAEVLDCPTPPLQTAGGLG
ncbi:M48 family metallopeptidase [Stutzerimonas azotifigens]|uniref:M48 family metallopeptidase n=1 Tax=Stutzerimonas azotifigens TaxID=291995 RepID=UPI0003F5A74F|nr:M48 family metallopeptidase [Stutzerimonas azotifigens]